MELNENDSMLNSSTIENVVTHNNGEDEFDKKLFTQNFIQFVNQNIKGGFSNSTFQSILASADLQCFDPVILASADLKCSDPNEEILELKNFLIEQAFEFGKDDFEREMINQSDPYYLHHQRHLIDLSITSNSEILIDCVLEYHESLLPDYLKELDLVNFNKKKFDQKFRNILDDKIKEGFVKSVLNFISETNEIKYFDPSFLNEEIFNQMKWTESFKKILNKRVDNLLQLNSVEFVKESLDRMISEITTISGLPHDDETFIAQNKFVSKLEKFESDL